METLEQRIDSREVAAMVGKEHKELLRDIRRYCEQLSQSKIALPDFFAESEYENRGKMYPCYNVTKKGCEFIAHKLTGVKGTEFTAKYINRFHEMEDALLDTQNKGFELSELSVELQAIIMHDKKIVKMEKRLDKLEYDIPLYGNEADELSDHVKRKGVTIMGGKKSEAYNTKGIRAKVYKDIYNQLKREFGLYSEDDRPKSYKALKRKNLYDAHEFIDAYDAPSYLKEMINDINAQIGFAGIA